MKPFSALITAILLSIILSMGNNSLGQAAGRDKQAKINVQARLNNNLAPYGLRVGSPVFIRIIKENRILELWGKPDNQQAYLLIKKYPIAGMSGGLGPKQKQGDKQAPEGFYEVTRQSLNPYSNYHLSFNIGYPNAYDRALGRTGSLIMVHGSVVSIGCFAITDEGIEEVYTMVADAMKNGQRKVHVQIYPFVPTIDRISREKESPFYDFWKVMEKAWNWTEKNRAPAKYTVKGNSLIVND